jgi:uncharacterized protein YjdB
VVPLTSSDPAVAEVPSTVTVPAGAEQGSFPVLAREEGSSTVTAGPVTGTTQTAAITVTPAALVSLTLTPPSATIAKGQTLAFLLVGTYTDTSVADLTEVAIWTTSDPAIATITQGQATGQGIGAATLTASVGTLSTTATLTVTPPFLVGLTITPANPTVLVGEVFNLTATGQQSDGTYVDLTSAVAWTSMNPLIVSVAGSGLATAVTPGTTAVIATHTGGFEAGMTITVQAPPPALTALTPATLTITQDEAGSLTATISAVQSSETIITVASSDPAVASVPSTTSILAGSLSVAIPVSGLAPGTAAITVTLNGGSQQSTVTVLAAAAPGLGNAALAGGLTAFNWSLGEQLVGGLSSGCMKSSKKILGRAATEGGLTAVGTAVGGGLGKLAGEIGKEVSPGFGKFANDAMSTGLGTMGAMGEGAHEALLGH